MFSRESRTKPSIATITGKGDNPKYIHLNLVEKRQTPLALVFFPWNFLADPFRAAFVRGHLPTSVDLIPWKPTVTIIKMQGLIDNNEWNHHVMSFVTLTQCQCKENRGNSSAGMESH